MLISLPRYYDILSHININIIIIIITHKAADNVQ